MSSKTAPFRVGRVRVFRRGLVWYLAYVEQGRRHQPRVGPDRIVARQMAAEINGQLEAGAPSALSFEPISIPDLRQRLAQPPRARAALLRSDRLPLSRRHRALAGFHPGRSAPQTRCRFPQPTCGRIRWLPAVQEGDSQRPQKCPPPLPARRRGQVHPGDLLGNVQLCGKTSALASLR